MSTLPSDFKADLRRPITGKHLDDSNWFQWSSPHMVEMTAVDTYQFVKNALTHPAQRILEIGCGNGFLTLELARDGHDVTGIDTSAEILAVAERTRTANPDTSSFGKLTYICTDFATWQPTESNFDVVIFNRALHHMPGLDQTIAKVKSLLKSGGKIICHDYAYDRLDHSSRNLALPNAAAPLPERPLR